jgi:hypothetical protein
VKSNWRIALFALALWMQLVFGLGMTLWRDALTLSGHWQIYAVPLPSDLNQFAEFAKQNIPPDESVGYLTPPGEDYKVRYARLAVWLYSRRLEWLANAPVTSPISGWTPINLHDSNWVQILRERGIDYLLIEQLDDTVPCQVNCIRFDATRYLWVLR